jgi:hypothetical protein
MCRNEERRKGREKRGKRKGGKKKEKMLGPNAHYKEIEF